MTAMAAHSAGHDAALTRFIQAFAAPVFFLPPVKYPAERS